MLRALAEYEIEGLKTLIPFHDALLRTRQWHDAETCRDLVEDKAWLKSTAPQQAPAKVEAGDEADTVEQAYTVEVSGRRFDVTVIGPAGAAPAAALNGAGPQAGARTAPRRGDRKAGGGAGGPDTLESPLQGNMWKVLVERGATVEEGQLLCIIEAMKMENEITAHKAGTIAELPIKEGDPIAAGATIAVIRSEAAAEG